jgi:WD40 repeat protein/TPR repeat protein
MGSAAYSPDGTQIVTAGFSPIARIWNAQVGMQLAILEGHSRGVGSARYSPDGSRILTASDKNLRVWDAASGALLSTLSPSGATYASADYSPDGTKLISASYDKTARVWDADAGLPITVLAGHAADVLSAAYSPDGTRIVTASYDSTARIWDTTTGSQIALLAGHNASVQWAAFAPDGKHVVTASLDGTGRIWDALTGFPLAFLYGHGGGLSSAVYSPDGKQIATASTDKTARIWDARTGQQLHVLSGHDATVESVTYSPDGIHVLTASKDKTIRIWSARTGEQLAVLLGHDDVVETAAYSPDGSRIVSASDDTTARIWAADVPLPLPDQIIWYKAAQTDILSDVDRTELGLNRETQRVRADSGTACDRAAGAFYDPDRVTTGVIAGHIIADVAIAACGAEIRVPRHSARIDYQMGRALLVKRELSGAKQHFEHAIAKGYRAAQIDLAKLLLDDTAGLVDPARAIALYEEAWKSGVQIAAYQLGYLYEMGMASVDNRAQPSLSPDMDKAQYWYEQAAAVNEPSALARYAERAERIALRESDPEKKNSLLLRSFRFYAAAAERASDEAWPDEVWRQWRYRRATLARVLARRGMMQQVVEALRFLLPSIAGSVSDFSAP